MVLLIIVPLAVFSQLPGRGARSAGHERAIAPSGPNFTRWFGRGWLGAGYLFLYLPIVALVLYLVQRLAGAERLARLHAQVVRARSPPTARCWTACGCR